ncbi:hypothetical protein BST95_12795 [Halioglobus japonicus]|uniref:Lipid kinase YegS n=1 Tax=Halioglobus japonicus TaxID=930805 RepID=A0AAP8MI81_9GAMM|nr:YegS/Rv2252/BmrU family lipid kinase [Halioglobus japonicus]AQA18988.1 hypothetical protein BST95_12795 [Halioglobus japonicus]PLW87997.1 lipid kinase YegS [Halioglobus japonicus]GHD20391.1 putative lipid kinase YegS-like protein [Halioglobus japonicus]
MRKRKQQPVLLLHRKSANRPEVKAAVKAVRRRGVDLLVRIPWNKRDKRKQVKALLREGYSRIIAGGGDGTLNAVADAVVNYRKTGQSVSMGILPLGTANDFAHGLALPCDDLEACLYLAATGKPRPLDIGAVNGRHFINVASGGFGAEVTATTPQDIKRHLGGLAYTLNGLVKLWDMKPYAGALLLPDQPAIPYSMLLMAVGNSRLAGGGFEVAPAADPADGLLDLMLLTEGALTDPTRALAEIQTPLNPDNTLVMYRQAKAFTLESEQLLHINLDGEPITGHRFSFEVFDSALDVVY